MIETQEENKNELQMRLQKLGEGWIQAIARRQLDQLAEFCQADLSGRLLLPRRLANVGSAAELLAKYHDWFDEYTSVAVEASQVAWIGEKLGIFYRCLLQDGNDQYRIEQQLYCVLKDGRVQEVHLLCSGFQLVAQDQDARDDVPARDELLEFHAEPAGSGGTCAVLTPMIQARLRGMRSGQVLEVRVNDPSAKGDVESWSRLSGNPLLQVLHDEGDMLRFFVKKK